MKTTLRSILILGAGLVLTIAHGAETSDILSPTKRQEILDGAKKLLAVREAPAVVADPFHSEAFNEVIAQQGRVPGTAAPTGPTPAGPRNDHDLLQAISNSLKPSGYFILQGQPTLVFGQKKVKAGSFLTITFEGTEYAVEITAIDRTNFYPPVEPRGIYPAYQIRNRTMRTRTLLVALFATALTMPGLAQQPATTAPETQPPAAPVVVAPAAPAPAAAVSIEGAAPTAGTVSRDKDTLSVDFPDEDIKTILRNVADLFELNLVVPDTLTGKTSIKLRDVSWRQIFHVVLAPVGYTYIEEGNIIKITSNELLQQEPVATEVFVLNNAKAADIKPTIDGLIDAATGGKIVIDGRSNALVITERPSRMGRIRTIIDQLDKATDQVMIESKFVEVTDRDIRNIGVNWAGLQKLQVGVGQIQQGFDRSRGQEFSNSVEGSNGSNSSTSSRSSTDTTGSTSGASATQTQTTNGGTSTGSTTVTVVGGATPGTTTTTTTTTTPGTNTVGGTSSTGTQSNVGTLLSNALDGGMNSAINNITKLANTGSTNRIASAVFSATDFNIILSALKTQSNTKIVSNPTVVTLNNTEATLNIGEEFPVPSYTYNSERGSFEVSGFTYKPIGVILKVTPQVNARGVIKMTLEPEVSQRNGVTSFGGAGGAEIPIIATRKAKTQVSLKDGYTMGIGGLITSQKSHGGTKVPVLGDIPLLGRLFTSKSVDDTVSNLLIFVTAKTVSADGASPEEVFDPRAVQAIGMSHDDLPGNRARKGTDIFAQPVPEASK